LPSVFQKVDSTPNMHMQISTMQDWILTLANTFQQHVLLGLLHNILNHLIGYTNLFIFLKCNDQ
jgi:hypothetical protein